MDKETESYIKAIHSLIRDLSNKDNTRQIRVEELERRIEKLEEKWEKT